MADFSRLPGPNADLWDWQLLAACRGVDSSLFFHPEGERGAARSARENSAKEVCMRCPVRAECAAHALAVREPYGVWGGLTEDEREEQARLITPAHRLGVPGGVLVPVPCCHSLGRNGGYLQGRMRRLQHGLLLTTASRAGECRGCTRDGPA